MHAATRDIEDKEWLQQLQTGNKGAAREQKMSIYGLKELKRCSTLRFHL